MDNRTDAQLDSSLIPQPSSLPTRRFRPYPEYQNSGAEWIGEIPSHWSTKRLKNLVHFQGGGTPSKENLEYWSGNIPWVSPKDMKTRLILDTADKITVEAVEESATNLVDPGAVLLVVRSGILNHTIPVAIAGTTVALNQDLKALIPGAEVLPKYLSYVIDGKQSPLLVEWRKEGATVESLEVDLIENSRFPLPPKPEQHSIVESLDRETEKIDALMAKKERLIELLLEKRTALITHAVTKGFDPDVPMKDSGVEWLGEIPAHWTSSFKLLQLAKQGRGTFVNGPFGSDLLTSELLSEGVPVIYIRDFGALGYHRVSSVCVTSEKARQLDFCRVDRGDILIAKVGDPPGIAAVYPDSELLGIVTQDVIRIKPNNNVVNRHYLTYFLNSAAGAALIDKIAVEATRRRISLGDFKRSRLILPPLQEQTAIAAFLDRECKKVERLITKIREGIDRLKEFRTALISAAVTGQIESGRKWHEPPNLRAQF